MNLAQHKYIETCSVTFKRIESFLGNPLIKIEYVGSDETNELSESRFNELFEIVKEE